MKYIGVFIHVQGSFVDAWRKNEWIQKSPNNVFLFSRLGDFTFFDKQATSLKLNAHLFWSLEEKKACALGTWFCLVKHACAVCQPNDVLHHENNDWLANRKKCNYFFVYLFYKAHTSLIAITVYENWTEWKKNPKSSKDAFFDQITSF